MAGELLSATQLLAAAAILGLAGWLLYLNFESRLHRALALVLFLRGSVIVLNRAIALDPARFAFWLALREYFFLALLPALAYFAATIALPRPTPAGRLARLGAFALGLCAEALYLRDHCLATCLVGERMRAGPLLLLVDGMPFAMAALALLLAISAAREALARRVALGLAASGFLLAATLDGAIALGAVLSGGLAVSAVAFEPSLWASLVFPLRMAALVPALAATVLVARLAQEDARRAWIVIVPVALATLSGLYLGASPAGAPRPLAIVLAGAWLLALPACLAYAILKHRLFEIDVRLRRGVVRTFVAGTLLATFLVVTELAQNVLDARYGVTLGGIATGLLLFTLRPIERVGGRLAQAMLPHAQPAEGLDEDDRLALYRDQASVAWEDGSITRKERMLLDQLRERLGIPGDVAARVESDVALHGNEAR